MAPARLVHDLAVRGTEVVSREKAAEAEAVERLVAFAAGHEDVVDWSLLEHIDGLASGE